MTRLRPSARHLVLVLSLLVGIEPAVLKMRSLPTTCLTETADKMCHKFFPKAIDDCLEVAEASDYIIYAKKVCFVGFLDRCLPIDFCPEALKKDSTKLTQKNGKTMNEETSQAKPDFDLDQEPEPDIDTQDAFNLLSTIGIYVFWTQLGIGLFLSVSLAITVGLLIWYRSQLRRLQSNQDGDDPKDPKSDIDAGKPPQTDSEEKPNPDPPADLNSAWEDADSQSQYDNTHQNTNPFTGFGSVSSFRPLGPPQAVTQIPMIQRPVAQRDMSTMTSETREALNALERNAIQSKKGERARWTESAEQLNLIQEQLLSATLSHLEQAGYYTRPVRHLPPQTPLRTSSLRGSRRNKRGRQERNIHHSEDHLPIDN